MNVFELFGKISIDASGAKAAISETTSFASEASSKLSSVASGVGTVVSKVGSVVGSVVTTAAQVTTAAVGVASAGVAALTKSAVENYAEYEQLVGGVETLFKDSASTVQWYALNAYKTAGMNANEYMDTVTSFSASLLQGLGGDTAKAAEYANTAITDMSDNANKMGTSISMIQNAYQGFAKQNYTMLDNLKLGYGGTASEMARLINDSGVLGDAVEVTAETINEVSFDKIIEAIHVMQEEMGIAGTTAKEASETISGSLASAKSAWQNLVGALANDQADLEYFVNNFVDSVATAAKNILPRIETALGGVGTLVEKLAPVISEAIPTLITEVLPDLIDAGFSVLEGVVTGIIEAIPDLVEQAPVLIEEFLDAIGDAAYLLWDAGETLIEEIGTAISEEGPEILEDAVDDLLEFLGEKLGASDESIESFKRVLEVAWETIGEIFESIKTAIDDVATACEDADVTWSDVWNGCATVIEEAGQTICLAIEAISGAVAWLVTEVTTDGTALNTAWNTLKETVSTASTVIQDALQFVVDVLNGDWAAAWEDTKRLTEDSATGIEEIVIARWGSMALKSYQVGYQIGLQLRENFEKAKEWALEKFDQMKAGISVIMEAAKTKVKSVLDSIKNFFATASWSLPKLKLPHLTISGSFSLNPPSVPSFSVEWYKKAMNNPMILESATAFGINSKGQIMAGGEAGDEVVSGKDTLMEMIAQVVASRNDDLVEMMARIYELLSLFMPQIIDGMEREMVLDSGVLVGQLTPAIDRKLGTISKYKARGN